MSWTKKRSELALVVRDHPDRPDLVFAARRDLRAARAEDYIRRLVAEAPELTRAQRDKLAALLRDSDAGDRAA